MAARTRVVPGESVEEAAECELGLDSGDVTVETGHG